MTDADKARIRAEEVFRGEVRRSLELPRTGIARLVRAINSPFALWLLSTVVVAGATAFYTRWKDVQSKESARVEDIERLDMEISYRFSRVLGAAHQASEAIRQHDALVLQLKNDEADKKLERERGVKREAPVYTPNQRKEKKAEVDELYKEIMSRDHPLVLLTRREGTHIGPLYTEFQQFTLTGLLVELRRKERPEKRAEIYRVLVELSDPYFDPLFNRNMRKADLLCTLSMRINESLLLKRWRHTGFQYVNCPESNPFCRNYIDGSGHIGQLKDPACLRLSEEEAEQLEEEMQFR